jgi:hypothetical protein
MADLYLLRTIENIAKCGRVTDIIFKIGCGIPDFMPVCNPFRL